LSTTPNHGRLYRLALLGGALLLALLFALLGPLATRADAEPRIKTNSCKVYATNRVDPIAFSQHLHHHFGNTSTTNSSTGESLVAANRNSCSAASSWFTSAAWFPVAGGVPVDRIAVYYRAPGDQTQVKAIPTGLGIVAHDFIINGGGDTVTVKFPDCWDQGALRNANMVMGRNGVCPSTHPYRIPRINFLIQYDGRVTSQTMVSSGADSFSPLGSAMHADYFAANQPVLNDELLDLCLRNAPDSVTVADPRCGRAAG
jgi:hypothetical protein